MDLISQLEYPVPLLFGELVTVASPTLAGFVDVWGPRQGLLSLIHLLGLLLEVRIRWAGAGLFCLAPVQVSIVQTGGFILLYTHPDLSLLGALFLENQNKEIMIH